VSPAPAGGALVKLAVAEGEAWVACAQSHAFRIEPDGSGPARIVAAPDGDQVGLLIDLSRTLPEPFVVLYVLLSMRTLRPPGRYQSSRPLGRSQLEAFLSRHRAFLEQDGRHHLWIGSAAEPSTLVYDQHQVLQLYGRLDAYLPVLRAAGMDEGPVVIPERHRHEWHAAFDADEHALLSEQAWSWNPLEPEDEELDD
jgi:hypothetical protein